MELSQNLTHCFLNSIAFGKNACENDVRSPSTGGNIKGPAHSGSVGQQISNVF